MDRLREILERPGDCITEDEGLQEAAEWSALYAALGKPRVTKRQKRRDGKEAA